MSKKRLPGAIPVMMGCTAATGRISAIAVALFLILFVWQIPHFLAIAILYRDDYAKGGFYILPVSDESLDVTARQIVLYCLALLPVTVFPVVLGIAGSGYLAIALVLSAMFTWLRRRLSSEQATRARPQALLGIARLSPLPAPSHGPWPPIGLWHDSFESI